MEALKQHRVLAILVGLHFILAIAYALVTPYRAEGRLMNQGRTHAKDIGAPDERQHANYVRHLLDGKGFPVLNPDPASPDMYESYQSHQPPAYYLIAGGVAKVGGLDLEERSGGLALRFLNGAIGAAGVAGVYFFVLWGIRRRDTAIAAATFAGLLPMNLALSGAISNDPLLIALGTWVLALSAKGIRDGWTAKLALLVGVLMGLAFLTKTNAVALWPALAAGLYLASKAPTSSSGNPRGMGYVLLLGLPVVLAAPWWLRNQQLYGDPLAMKAFTAAFVGSAQASDFIKELGAFGYWSGINDFGLGVGWWTLRSFFGVFGYMDVFWPSALYGCLSVLLAMALLGRFGAQKENWIEESRAVRGMGGALFLIVLALFLRFNAQYFQGQARYLLPAMAPIAATIAIGMGFLSRNRPSTGTAVMAAVLLGLNIYTLTLLPTEFARRILAAAL